MLFGDFAVVTLDTSHPHAIGLDRGGFGEGPVIGLTPVVVFLLEHRRTGAGHLPLPEHRAPAGLLGHLLPASLFAAGSAVLSSHRNPL